MNMRLPEDDAVIRNMQNVVNDMEHFAGLGELTGGGSFVRTSINLDVMRELLHEVEKEAAGQYVAGFHPPASDRPPGNHKIESRLAASVSGKIQGGKRVAVY